MSQWGSADHHPRVAVAMPKPLRVRCRYCPTASRNRVTHLGTANGVALMSGCEWHVHRWAREGVRKGGKR